MTNHRAILLSALVTSCTIFNRPPVAPTNDVDTVLLISGGLMPPMNKIARHPWFATREAGTESWRTWEVGGPSVLTDPFRNSPYVEPILLAVWRGDSGRDAIACISKVAPEVQRDIERNYMAWPGPNSNTFADIVLRKCKLAAPLTADSIGKDYRGWIGAGISSERTGVQVETPVVGLKVGLREGIELHVIGLSFGIDLWPPAIIVPIGGGRLGFADR